MPVIKARTRGKHLARHITRLDRESYETLFAYAAFLDEPPEYVLNQLIDTVLAKDREFLTWRDAHTGSHAPRPVASASQSPKPPCVKRRDVSRSLCERAGDHAAAGAVTRNTKAARWAGC